jgi:hypothetical protein
VQPGTPFETGDSFDPSLSILPAIRGNVELTFRLAPDSDASKMITKTVAGSTNRFGWFHGTSIPITAAGEYRVDIKVTGIDANGAYWAGFRTWGGVVAPRNSALLTHGRRAFENAPDPKLPWFMLPESATLGSTHVFFPFHSGDVMWGADSGAEMPVITFQDPASIVTPLLHNRRYQFPDFDDRAAIGETPLFTSNPQTIEPHLEPSLNDVWGYSYRAVARPMIRVREMIGEEQLPSGVYWHFDAQYERQFGMGKSGDLPGDFKFQYGGLVLRGSAIGRPQYAIYGSSSCSCPTTILPGSVSSRRSRATAADQAAVRCSR